ncbi:putative ArsR family transcriptional regulator [Arcanobacterium pluranimalium]|uniref:hypothetical protein n=1 Tax=Arcanobacterium pluranimalium TaxID=108028 RepID=UPI00195AAB26|nr:hypothetical protein [Arcanobacterium pluranimalium]MBM7824599.1 putative ArsR family transcriptional regulator [Arcanobacterium pluranimalium]
MKLSEIQKSILSYLQKKEDWVTILEIAETLQVHPNSARSAVTKLTNGGMLERSQHRDGKKGRPTFVFRARTGRFPVLREAIATIEHSTEQEKAIVEALISGKYEGILENEEDLMSAIMEFLERIDIECYEEDGKVYVSSCPLRNMDDDIPGFTCRMHRMIIQQAVGKRGTVLLSPVRVDGECRLSVRETKMSA